MLDEKTVRISRYVAGVRRGPMEILHLPTGLKVNQEDGESRYDALARLEQIVRANTEPPHTTKGAGG